MEELAKLMGKSRWEVEEMLKRDDVIDLNLNERGRSRHSKEDDELRIFE